MERIRWSLGKLVDKREMTREAADEVLGRIRPVLDLAELPTLIFQPKLNYDRAA